MTDFTPEQQEFLNSNAAQQMLADLQNPVDLHPDLEAALVYSDFLGVCLKHPLVYAVPYAPMFNRNLNHTYEAKVKEIATAKEERNWDLVLILHERPYRVDAFDEIEDLMTDEEYWNTLAWLWVDSENIRENTDVWERLLLADRPGREHFMTEEEQAELAAMPDTITIYQGHTVERDDGWSWTTNRETAEWFARRFANMEDSQPQLSTATVRRQDVFAYLTSRGESEILIDPDLVSGIITEDLADG